MKTKAEVKDHYTKELTVFDSWIKFLLSKPKPEAVLFVMDAVADYYASQKNEWIGVEERLPETPDNVLAILDGEVCVMAYFDFIDGGSTYKVWGYAYDGISDAAVYDDNYKPTHWQPIPTKP